MLKNFKKAALIVVVIILVISFGGCTDTSKSNNDLFFRIHIRANSNSQSDQNIKYAVKQEISNYLTPLLAKCNDKAAAYKVVENNLNNIKQISDRVLDEKGYKYKSSTKITREEFPLRSYGEFSLESGEYDALIINLGTGEGDNWWCVVYPPLCFIGGESNNEEKITYKSKIAEIIKEFKETIYS